MRFYLLILAILTSISTIDLVQSFGAALLSFPTSRSISLSNFVEPPDGDRYFKSPSTTTLLLYRGNRAREGNHYWSMDSVDGTELLDSILSIHTDHDWKLSNQQLNFYHLSGVQVRFPSEGENIPIVYKQRILTQMIEQNALASADHIIAGHDITLPKSKPSSKEIWTARLLLILSAALYGTNFTMVKTLDESLSVGVCSTLRFGFAALSMLPWLFAPINEELKTKYADTTNNFEEPTRLNAGLAGMEIGMWNSVGYIAQALSLKTTTASKVRGYLSE